MTRFLPLTLVLFVFDSWLSAADPLLRLNPGDHVCIIGNTLADRMQHDGWLETYLHARFPGHHLTVRNLGFSGDELTQRLRSLDFGTPDEWLSGRAPIPRPEAIADKTTVKSNRFEATGTNADVVFAFFGHNESWAGEPGVAKFQADLDAFVKHTLAQKYNGKSAPRLVLFSPTAFENHKTPNLPTGEQQNANLARYTAAMATVARANGVPFVDLFGPTRQLYATASAPLTINGVHLTSEGNRQLADVITTALMGAAAQPNTQRLDTIRQAVVAKNALWFHRYRATDGYSTFGGRAWLKFIGGQTNYEVVQRELEVIDQMVLNRDPVIWDAANGKEQKPKDTNLPPFVPVTTNKPGSGPGGKHLFLGGAEAIASMTVGKGMKVNLFADEKLFPELVNPVQMAWDPAGRLWVAVWPTYPHWKPTESMDDKLLVLEDTTGDGIADKCTTFAGGLHNPTGFEFYNGGVIVAQAPDLVFLKDTNGDGKADLRERIVHGLDTADTHHTSNSFVLDPGGALYFQEGTFHHSQVEDAYGPPKRVANGAVFRYEPRAQKFGVYVSYGFANPHGHVFDRWGQDIVVDGTGAVPYHAPLFSGHLPYPLKHAKPPQVYQQRTRPCPGMEYLSSRHFPPEFDGNLLVANVIGFQGILRYRIEDDGASLKGTELEPILSSRDPNFRPTDLKTAPDGSLYFIDWQNPIIGHMQHNLRDPSRDREHGRIYRVTHEGRALQTPVKIAGEPIPALLDLLKSPDDRVRSRAKIELGGRPTTDVIAAMTRWGGLGEKSPNQEHNMLEALWVHQYHNVINVELLERVLKSPDFRARAAATRVLCYWQDRIPNALARLKELAGDEHPRVRMEAVRAASFLTQPEAIEVVLIAKEKPKDAFVDHVSGETLKALGPIVRDAIAAGKEIRFTTPAGSRYFLQSVPTSDLATMKRSPGVFEELLHRPGVRDELRREAAAGLAAAAKSTDVQILMRALKEQDRSDGDDGVVFDLARLLTSRPNELAAIRPDLEALARTAVSPVLRQMGYVALVATDGSSSKAWAMASKTVGGLRDLVTAIPQIRDPGERASLYPQVRALLDGLPADLAESLPKDGTTMGRYVFVELPGKQRTLTLAEVEVLSDGRNVARQGTATQSSTAYGGDAARGIDGKTGGGYGEGGQTHTQEGTDQPWWQVDLGAEFPIDSVVVYNRTDGNLGGRLNNFTVRVLDGSKSVVFQQMRNAAPKVSAKITVGGESPGRVVRRAAMVAMTSVRGKEVETFRALAKMVNDPKDRAAAIAAIQRIPTNTWPTDAAAPLLRVITEFVRTVPVADRTSPAVLDAMQLAYSLSGLLPRDQARAARKSLGQIGVRVLRVGTLTDQMLFDVERLVVQAGKPVEFVFENTDIMPHNFVVTRPGSLEEVGNAAEAFGTQPGAQARHFVPPSDKVLLASRLLMPRDTQALRFSAPTRPGVYPYVCTYPGHWRRMHGALYVVDDLDAYLDSPEEYLATHSVPVADELLKFNRPRTEWKLADLSPALAELNHGGRSFAHGKQLFTITACVACHKFGGQGNELGPDLTKLDAKEFSNATDVLKHLLDPSLRIEDKYRQFTFDLLAGGTVTGMVLETTPGGDYKVIENPLAKAEPRLIRKADVDGNPKPSASSIMPKGLLDKLTKDEILDLLAYVVSKGDPSNPAFQGGHDHHHH